MRLYELLDEPETIENGLSTIKDTGETFPSTVACKKEIRLNPEKYSGKHFKLFPDGEVDILPKSQTILKFE